MKVKSEQRKSDDRKEEKCWKKKSETEKGRNKNKKWSLFGWIFCGLKWRERERRIWFKIHLCFAFDVLSRLLAALRFIPMSSMSAWRALWLVSTTQAIDSLWKSPLNILVNKESMWKERKKKGKKKDDQTTQGLQKKRYIKKGATEEKTFKNENSKRKMFKNTWE